MMIPHRPPTGWIAVVALIATWTTLADPPRLTAQSGSGVGVEGSAPPVAPEVITRDDLGNATPMLDLCSMLHETQYTRLFRS